MDFECDVGFTRADQGSCSKIPDYDKQIGSSVVEDAAATCESFGYYTVTQGYRKIPGNRCYGGLDLNPTSYSCSGVSGLFSLKNVMTLLVVGLIIYFGWPAIEAIVLILPIPDPKDMLERVTSLFNRKPAPKGRTPASK